MATTPIVRVPGLIDAGILVRVDGTPAVVLIRDGLPRPYERCVVAHELRHADDAWCTDTLTASERDRHEERIDRDAAHTLTADVNVPAWCRDNPDATIHDAATDWDITPRYAAIVLAAAGMLPWSDVPRRSDGSGPVNLRDCA